MGSKKRQKAAEKRHLKQLAAEGRERRRKRRIRIALVIVGASVVAVGVRFALHRQDPAVDAAPASPGRPDDDPRAVPQPDAALAQARADPGMRQAYLDRTLEGLTLPHCAGVVYDHDGSAILAHIASEYERVMRGISYRVDLAPYEEQYRGGQYDIYTPVIWHEHEPGHAYTIFVGRWTFEQYAYMTGAEFRHVLAVHEARHCEQYASGLGYFDPARLMTAVQTGQIRQEIAYEVAEMDANRHGLAAIDAGRFPVNPDYHRRVQQQYRTNQARLRGVLPVASPVERELIRRALAAPPAIEPDP